jgi:hypothetical protein
MDPEGRLHPVAELSPKSALFDELLANESHIPIIQPSAYP